MPRRKVRFYMGMLAEKGVLSAWQLSRAGELTWVWAESLHEAMAARLDFVKVPKPILWDGTLTGVEKLVYAALHRGLFFAKGRGWLSTDAWYEQLVISQDRYLTAWTGLAQSTISEALVRLEYFGLICIEETGRGDTTALRLISLTARYCWQAAPPGGRHTTMLWVPFDKPEVDFRWTQLAARALATNNWQWSYQPKWWTTAHPGHLPNFVDTNGQRHDHATDEGIERDPEAEAPAAGGDAEDEYEW